ncbi:hypothetical protein, partial [Bacteroides heparinolyticus]
VFTDLKRIETEISVTDEKLTLQTYVWEGDCRARYVRLRAKSNGIVGSWIFMDELVVGACTAPHEGGGFAN